MTTTDDELLALARKATPGEWRQDVMYVTAEIRDGRPGGEVIVEARATVDRHRDRARDVANAAYIAAANPSAIIAMLERHRAEVELLTRVRYAAFKGYLISCPRCGLYLGDEIMLAQMSHLIRCGDKHRGEAQAALATVTRERDEARKMHKLMCDLALHRANETEAAETALAAAQKRIAELSEKLIALANAADVVGVNYFDTDTMDPEVQTMQSATIAARAALASKEDNK